MGIGLEEIVANAKYRKKDTEFGSNNDDEVVWSTSGHKKEEAKVYTYDEAIELTGNGWYQISLLMTLVMAIQGMAFDMFGFSYVVLAATCDLQFSHEQTSLLLSVPLMGAIISAYFHGYITDIRGRKKCLSVVLWGSFVTSCLSALSPNFAVLAVLKLISSSMCSGVQSMAYTLLGESCSVHTKGTYMLILSSSLVSAYAVFTSMFLFYHIFNDRSLHAYLVLGLDFTYNMGYIIFKPWRLLILTLAMALGFSAVIINFSYESPKFLVNSGRTAEALEILRKIKKRNRGDGHYPVKKVILLEANSSQPNDVSFLRSLLGQTAPLFKPPLLQKTLLLFYITAVTYSVNNGFFLWIPILTRSFFEESSAFPENVTENFCNLLNSRNSHSQSDDCTAVVSLQTLLIGIVQGVVFLIINCGVCMLAHKKKTMIILISLLSSFCCFAMLFITEKIITIILFFGVQTNCFIMGIVFCYYIELYPTCHRGMISCLGVMMARISAIVGVRLVGTYAFNYCSTFMYVCGAYIFSSVLISFLLPTDTPKKSAS